MNVVFTSERLLFREFTAADAHLILILNSDPEVVKYLHEPILDLVSAQEVIDDIILPQYKLNNYGRWAVHLLTDLSFIGWCGLKFRPDRNAIDLGYRFMKKYWGAGYASEAAARTTDYGFEVLQLSRIFACAHQDNIVSQKVIIKTGFQFIGNDIIDNCTVKTYERFRHPIS